MLVLSFIVGLVMFLDRACIGTATPSIMRDFHLSKIAMGWSVSAFNWTYALFQVPGGWLADRFGSRIVLTAAIVWWSVFTAATGAAGGAASLAITRALFGMGEAAAWPAASRSLLRWLPPEQRAFGQGFQHSGSRLGRRVRARHGDLSDCALELEGRVLCLRRARDCGGDRVVSSTIATSHKTTPASTGRSCGCSKALCALIRRRGEPFRGGESSAAETCCVSA